MKFPFMVNVIDVECTCQKDFNDWKHGEKQEIIEIGISVVDTQRLVIVENESILVKPQMSTVSKFCTELTTLTQNQVDGGISFAYAIKLLEEKYNTYKRTWLSWGNFDRKMFETNCRDFGCKYPFGASHINLKNTFAMLHGLRNEPGMDAALDYLKLPLEGTHHRADCDSKNIANILINTLKQFRK